MMPRRLRGLSVQVLIWAVLPLTVVLGGIAIAAVVSHRSSMSELVQRVDARTAQMAADHVSHELGERVTALESTDGRAEYLFDGGVARFGPSGEVLEASPSAEAWRGRPYESVLQIQGDSPALSPFFIDPESGQYMALLSVREGGQMVVGAASAESLGLPVFARDAAGAGQFGYVVSGAGMVLYHSDPSFIGEDFGGRPGVGVVLRGESGATGFRDDAGKEWAVGYAPVAGFDLGLVVQEPWSGLESPMMNLTLFTPLVVVVAAVFSAAAVAFGLRYVVRPLQTLDSRARGLAWGDLSAIDEPVGGVQEIEGLRRTLADMARQVRRYQESMRDYIGAITAAQEEERRRLARELHDETVQSLIALGHQVERVQRSLKGKDKDPALVIERLEEMRRMLCDTQEEVRRFSRALRPLYLEDLGFLPALEMLVKDINEAGGLRADLHVEGEFCRLSPALELSAYRIAQEALQNVQQHAEASNVELSVVFGDNVLVLRVSDDGVGFEPPPNPAELAYGGHFGLMGMRERALLFGGRLEMDSEPGRGTTLTVTLPDRA